MVYKIEIDSGCGGGKSQEIVVLVNKQNITKHLAEKFHNDIQHIIGEFLKHEHFKGCTKDGMN